MPCSRASEAMQSWIGPLPCCSACATLSLSLMPMMGQYSGRATRSAPLAAASPTRRRAVARLSLTVGVETICTAATIVMSLLLGVGARGRGGGRRWIVELGDGRRLPWPRDLHLVGQRLHHRRAQEELGQEAAQADHGIDRQAVHQRTG